MDYQPRLKIASELVSGDKIHPRRDFAEINVPDEHGFALDARHGRIAAGRKLFKTLRRGEIIRADKGSCDVALALIDYFSSHAQERGQNKIASQK
jgi:hypothetical protein